MALKTVRRQFAGLEKISARLRRDIQLVHRIAHPNVCKIHYLGIDRRSEGDVLFLIMDFLEGENLAERLERGPLPKAVTLRIARQIADGLDAAHQEGVIHRDLKGSNVMLVPRKDGTTRAVITDFGIARGQEEDDAVKLGSGTDAYMSPERMSEPGAKPADIYSFGVILYEMITGRLPFEPGTPLEQRRKRPPAPSTIRAGSFLDRSILPRVRRWDRAILRCLDPLPEKRFARAADVVAALRPARWPIPVAAAFVMLLFTGEPILDSIRRLIAGPVHSVAIFPFEIAGGLGLQDPLADYLADQMQKSPVIRRNWLIIPPAEVRQMNVTTPAQARAVFGAHYVLATTVTREPESVTLVGSLSDAENNRPIRPFRKTCPSDDALCLQDGMLQAVSGVLNPQSSSSIRPAPISNEALQYYLQGLHYLRRDSVSYDLAIPFFQQALEKDPSAAQPRVALADAYMLRFREASSDKKLLDAARKILDEVRATHPDLSELHAALGSVHELEGRYEAAARELLLAVQADPSNHVFHRMLGHVYDLAGQDAAAVAEFEKVIRLQPRYWAGYLNYAVFHWRRGRFQEAAALLERLIEWAPDHAQGLGTLGGVYVEMGRNADAERVSNRSCQLKPARTCNVNLGIALQRQLRSHEAIAAYQRALAFGTPTVMLLFNLADAYAYLGMRPEALDFFRRAAALAQERLKINLRDSGVRAILAYCKAQIGDKEGAVFELEQALQDSPADKNVRKYGVLTYESIGQRDKALEILRGSTKEVLEELELAWGTEQLRKDPRYPKIAQEIKEQAKGAGKWLRFRL